MKNDEPNTSGADTSDNDGVVQTTSHDGNENAGHAGASENTKRGLKARHAQMIALGGTIGQSSIPSFLKRSTLTEV